MWTSELGITFGASTLLQLAAAIDNVIMNLLSYWRMEKKVIQLPDVIAASDADRARARKLPGYDNTLAAMRAEQAAAEMIDAVRSRTSLSQREIARRMRVSQPRVSKISSSDDMSLSTFFRYAEACGVRFRVWPSALPPLEVEEVVEIVEEV